MGDPSCRMILVFARGFTERPSQDSKSTPLKPKIGLSGPPVRILSIDR